MLWSSTHHNSINKNRKLNSFLGLEHPESNAMYENADQMVEKWTKRMVYFLTRVLGFGLIFPKAIQCYFLYFATDSGAEAFALQVPMWWDFCSALHDLRTKIRLFLNKSLTAQCVFRFPFDWKNPIGYSFAVLIQVILSVLMLNDAASLWPFLLAVVLYINAGAKDLTRTLKTINKSVKKKKLHSHIMARLSESLDFYSDLKR